MFVNFIKTALRNIKKQKIYFIINLAGLSLGITASIMIALYVADELSYDKFHKNAEKIVRVTYAISSSSGNFEGARTSPLYGPTLSAEYPEVDLFNRFKVDKPILKYKEIVFETRNFFYTDPDVFDIFSIELIAGDRNTALKEINSLLLSEKEAVKLFGNSNPIGKTVILNDNRECMITGIFKDLPTNTHIKIDYLSPYPQSYYKWMDSWGNNTYYTYLKLKENTSAEYLQSRMPEFVKKYFGAKLNPDQELRVNIQPITDIHLNSNVSEELEINGNYLSVIIFTFVSIFLLLIASINFINLSTARSALRAKEVGLRKVVGADRKSLILQFIGEAVFMVFLSGIIGIIAIELLLNEFNTFTGKGISIDYFTNPYVIPGMILFILILGICAGIYPAFVLSSFKPVKTLGSKSAATPSGFNATFRNVLVIVQFVISISFITCTLFISSQLDFILSKDTGFSKEQILLLPFGSFNKEVVGKFETFKNRLLEYSEISFVTMSGDIPGNMNTTLGFSAEGIGENKKGAITAMIVEPDFLKTYGMEIIAGRDFNRNFQSDLDEAIIINESAAKLIGFENSEQALGKKFNIMKKGKIIGVVKDFNYYSLHKSIEPLVISYWPDWFGIISIKLNSSNLSKTKEYIKEVWNTTFSNKPFNYSFFDQDFNRQYQADQNFKKVFVAFSTLTIFIACLGILGLISFSAKRRTREIGIRKILGASEISLATLLVKDFVLLVVIANIAALPLIYFSMTSWLEGFAYRITLGFDHFLYGGLISLVLAVSIVCRQAIKASVANPVDTLRNE